MGNSSRWITIIGRLASAIPLLASVIVVTFVLTRLLPGDPAAYLAGPSATKETLQEIRQALGLDKGLLQQFAAYVGQLSVGDFGRSFTTGHPVAVDIGEKLPATLELIVVAVLLAVAIAFPLGVLAAVRQDSLADHLCRLVTTIGVSVPAFFSGLVLIFVVYYLLGWTNAPVGRLDLAYSPPPAVTHFYLLDSLIAGDWPLFRQAAGQILLPATTIAFAMIAPIARMTRASMLAALGSGYVRTARSLGLSGAKVVGIYALRNALLPVVTTLGMVFSFAMGASVLVEKVFAWPGMGSYALDAVSAADYAPVQGAILVLAVLYLLINLSIDIIYTLIDPRIGR